MRTILIFTCILFSGVIIFSCKKEKNSDAPTNLPPVSNAGPDLFVLLPEDSVFLFGNGTDIDGSITGFRWQQVSGPGPAFIVQPSVKETIARNLIEGIYTFELTVTDNGGLEAKDFTTVVVGVNDPCFGCWDY